MTPPHTLAPTTDRTVPGAAQPPTREFGRRTGRPSGDLSDAYLQDYAGPAVPVPFAPPAAAPPISPRSSAAPRGPPR